MKHIIHLRRCVVRFPGNPTGYQCNLWDGQNKGWAEAKIGLTDKQAWVNLDQAYVIELLDEDA